MQEPSSSGFAKARRDSMAYTKSPVRAGICNMIPEAARHACQRAANTAIKTRNEGLQNRMRQRR